MSLSCPPQGATGHTSGVVAVGQKLQKLYGKNATASRASDPTLNTLGFSTDNGAYYYGKPEVGKNMEQTMIDFQKYSKQAKLPIQYALLGKDCLTVFSDYASFWGVLTG